MISHITISMPSAPASRMYSMCGMRVSFLGSLLRLSRKLLSHLLLISPARGPLILGNYAFDKAAPKEVFDLIASRTIPVVKLSHKWRFEGSLAGTPLGVLTGLEKL